MNPDVTKTFIAVGTGIVGIIIGNFKEEIKNFFVSAKKYRYLKGAWSCSWKEAPSKKYPAGKTMFDVVEITNIRGRLIWGKGESKIAGHWDFKGHITDSTLTITYSVQKGADKSGTIIMERNIDVPDRMNGCWCQFRKDEIVNGTTIWEKH